MGEQEPGFHAPTRRQPGGGFSPLKGGWLPPTSFRPELWEPAGLEPPSSVPKAGSWAPPCSPVREASRLRFRVQSRPLPSLRELSGLETRPDAGEMRSHFPLGKVTPRISDGHTYCPASGVGGGMRRTAVRGRCAPGCGGLSPCIWVLPGLHFLAVSTQDMGKVGPAGTVCAQAVSLSPLVPASPLEVESVLSRFLTYFLSLSSPRCVAFLP